MDQLTIDVTSSDDGYVAARSLRAVVWRGQFVAAMVLPIGLIVGSVLAGGGLLFAGFALFAVPLMLVLAVPPLLGRYAGRIRRLSQLPVAYCVVSLALWVVVLPLGYFMTSGQPAPVDLGPVSNSDRVIAQVCLVAAPILWIALSVLGSLGRRLVVQRPLTIGPGQRE